MTNLLNDSEMNIPKLSLNYLSPTGNKPSYQHSFEMKLKEKEKTDEEIEQEVEDEMNILRKPALSEEQWEIVREELKKLKQRPKLHSPRKFFYDRKITSNTHIPFSAPSLQSINREKSYGALVKEHFRSTEMKHNKITVNNYRDNLTKKLLRLHHDSINKYLPYEKRMEAFEKIEIIEQYLISQDPQFLSSPYSKKKTLNRSKTYGGRKRRSKSMMRKKSDFNNTFSFKPKTNKKKNYNVHARLYSYQDDLRQKNKATPRNKIEKMKKEEKLMDVKFSKKKKLRRKKKRKKSVDLEKNDANLESKEKKKEERSESAKSITSLHISKSPKRKMRRRKSVKSAGNNSTIMKNSSARRYSAHAKLNHSVVIRKRKKGKSKKSRLNQSITVSVSKRSKKVKKPKSARIRKTQE